MKPKGSIIKRTKGKKVSWWARVIYVDPDTGKTRDLQRRAESKAKAGDLRDELLKDIKATSGRSVGSEDMTFGDLCRYFEEHYVKEAEYVNGRKVAGLRSLASVKGHLNTLRDQFGRRKLRSLTYGNIRQFRAERLKQPDARYKESDDDDAKPKQRSIASVNRELALLRRMLNVATSEGWLIKNPFTQGEPLISTADEMKRQRILSRDEEKTLLAACDAPKRGHLKSIVIAALDTGCRLGELLKLRWRDVDLNAGQITLVAFNTKTATARRVALTTRLKLVLAELKEQAPDRPEMRVFGILNNVKSAFSGARKDAGLQDVRFHDLRHTAATRLVAMHIPLSEVGRILGHSQANTTYRYVNADIETAKRAAAALDSFHAADERAEQVSAAIN
jgi:integrase